MTRPSTRTRCARAPRSSLIRLPTPMEDRFGWMMETEHLLYRFGEAVHIRTVIERQSTTNGVS